MEGIEDVNPGGKRVLLRTDLNLPVEDGEPKKTVRFDRYLQTVQELSKSGAKTVVMSHQGRPARQDFISLKAHADMISEAVQNNVRFVNSFFGPQLENELDDTEKGEVLVLENVRFLSEELQNVSPRQHSRSHLVQSLKDYFDLHVVDAFSAAHRSHASLVGFTPVLDSYAGPVMRRELENCSMVKDEFEEGILLLGGEKPSDIIGMMEHMIEDVEKVLLAGIPGELALIIEGYDLGQKKQWISENSFDASMESLEQLLEEYRHKIVLPEDLRTDSGVYTPEEVPGDELTWDIGNRTIETYCRAVSEADAVVMKGPTGAFEDYPEGSKEIVSSLADSDGFTVMGGGHTSSLVQRFGCSIDDFSHVSIAGGAFVRHMSGEKLAAIEALEISENK